MFIFFRMLSGIAVGAATLVCPMYIAEISPAGLRGRFVTFYQLAIVSGILPAYLSNYLFLNTGENDWRWMFSSQSFPALLFFMGLFFVPESPRWLVRKDREHDARKIFAKIVGHDFAQKEIHAIKASFSHTIHGDVKNLFKRDVRGIVGLGIMIAVFSQIDGQNSLFSFAPEIFQDAGMAKNSAFQQSIMLGLIYLILYLLSSLLAQLTK